MEDYGGLRATGSNPPPQDEGFLSNIAKSFGRIDPSKTAGKFAEIPKALAPLRQFDPQFSIPTFDMQIDPFNMGRMGSTGMSAQYGQPIEYLKGSDLIPFGELALYGDQMSPTGAAISAASEILPEGVGPAVKGFAMPLIAKNVGIGTGYKKTGDTPSIQLDKNLDYVKNPTPEKAKELFNVTEMEMIGANTDSGKYFISPTHQQMPSGITNLSQKTDYLIQEGLNPNYVSPPIRQSALNMEIGMHVYRIYDNNSLDKPIYNVVVKEGFNSFRREQAYNVFRRWARTKGLDNQVELPKINNFYKNQRPMEVSIAPVIEKAGGAEMPNPFGKESYEKTVGNQNEVLRDAADGLMAMTGASTLFGKRATGATTRSGIGKGQGGSPRMAETISKRAKQNIGVKNIDPESTLSGTPGSYTQKPIREQDEIIMKEFWKDVITGRHPLNMQDTKSLHGMIRQVNYPNMNIHKTSKLELQNTYFFEALDELKAMGHDLQGSNGLSFWIPNRTGAPMINDFLQMGSFDISLRAGDDSLAKILRQKYGIN